MSTAAIDTTAAQVYNDQLVPALFAPWARLVVELAAPMPGETVLDVACGTGIGARLVAAYLAPGGKVISCDIDPAMIAVARQSARQMDLHEGTALEWHIIAAEHGLVEDASIDLCLCMQGPQFVSDPPVALQQIHNALKPGGRIAASMWNEYSTNKGHYAIGQALRTRGLKPALKPFSMGDPAAARQLFEQAGFGIERFDTAEKIIHFPSARTFVGGVAAGAPATRHALAQLSSADYEGFVTDVEERLSPFATEQGLALPTSAHVVVARR